MNNAFDLHKIIKASALCAGLVVMPLSHAEDHSAAHNKAAVDSSLPPLPIEEIGHVKTLPATYPEDWIIVDEANFFNMSAGKLILLDSTETKHSKRIKGIIDKSYLGNFTLGKKRPEIYIIETFHERGTRGKKTDYLTIYNKETLKIVKEIPWPTDRLQALPERYSMALSGDEKFLYVSNFSPASSFTVVDLDTYTITDTIGTPGCILTYPSGNRGITSICSNGGLLSTVIDDQGKLKSRHTIEPFFDSMKTPIFERPAIVDGIAHFPSFTGVMHDVDLRNDVAKYLGSWSLLTDKEKATNYRPSGLAMIDADDQGLAYIIMQPNGHEGSHQHGGNQVWVFDVVAKKRVSMVNAPSGALSLGVTRGKTPKLIITNGELALDVIDPVSGKLIQTLSDFGNVTPLMVNKTY